LFIDRILPEEGDAKFADVWPNEKVWGILKEKVRGEQFSNFEQLKIRLNKEWKKITCNDCRKMIDDIPKKLGHVIKNGGEQRTGAHKTMNRPTNFFSTERSPNYIIR